MGHFCDRQMTSA